MSISTIVTTERVEKVWVTQAEAAEYLGVTDRTIRNYITDGKLPAHHIAGMRLIRLRASDVEALIQPIGESEDTP